MGVSRTVLRPTQEITCRVLSRFAGTTSKGFARSVLTWTEYRTNGEQSSYRAADPFVQKNRPKHWPPAGRRDNIRGRRAASTGVCSINPSVFRVSFSESKVKVSVASKKFPFVIDS